MSFECFVFFLLVNLPTAQSFQPLRGPNPARGLSSSARSSSAGIEMDDPIVDSLVGGDYAGHSATFSSDDGSLIRVPEHLVPDSLIEWGQVPSCLEVLTSEDLTLSMLENDGVQGVKLCIERKVAAVVPEVGCGVDNLDTLRSSEWLDLVGPSAFEAFESSSSGTTTKVLAWESPLSPLRHSPRVKIETVFSLPDQIEPVLDDEESGAGEQRSFSRRLRVVFEVLPSATTISSPITVVLERRTGESTGGTIGLEGGLDASTVAKLVGKENYNRPFADQKGGGKVIDSDDDSARNLSLPGNIIVRYGMENGKFRVDVNLLSTSDSSCSNDHEAVVGYTRSFDLGRM